MFLKTLSQKVTAAILLVFLIISILLFSSINVSAESNEATHTGNVLVENYLNVRSGPGTSYTSIGKLYKDNLIYIYEKTDNNWYKISYGDSYGYVSADYITNVTEIVKPDENLKPEEKVDFETFLEIQKFPKSYKALLRKLHNKYPNWVFTADHLNMTWEEAVSAESAVGVSLVQNVSSVPDSWKSMAEGAYDWENNTYISKDSGNWVSAEREVVEYYMEPRNFLNENLIFMFLEQGFNPSVHTKEGLQLILNGTFMEGAFPESSHSTYADVIIEAAQKANVSPYLLASSIIIEQGTSGLGSCISGSVENYNNYFNFYNIGAYVKDGNSAVVNGLIYASSSGSYGRPWDTRAKSIIGGAEYYANSFVKRGQDTLYYKKFNVITPTYYKNQYMSNVQAAYSEASKLFPAYSVINPDAALSFSIPVYKEMPETNNTYLPTSTGANNYYLSSISINGTSFSNFNKYKNYYESWNNALSIDVSATPLEGASVEGTGNINLGHGRNAINLTVTAASGKTSVYTLVVYADIYTWKNFDGNWYCYDLYGNMVTGWAKYNEKWYYMDDTGIMQTGWIFLNDTWYYLKADGAMYTGWFLYADNWYYLADTGYMVTGWNYIDGYWYYFNSDGVMQTGWIEIDGQRYLLQENGAMYTGWICLEDKWHYIRENGEMQTGWIDIEGFWYYFDSQTVMQTGWILLDNNWYYLEDNGAMFIGWKNYKDKWYYLREDGIMATGWLTLGEKRYYLNSNGEMQMGWQTIDNVRYLFDDDGKCVEGAHKFVIDISKWQGDIDWEKLSKNPIDAIIMRSSYGGTPTEEYSKTKDSKYDEYLSNIKKYNIPYGFYHFNTATTVELAQIQANNVVKILKDSGADPSFPVFVDVETEGGNCDLIAITKVYMEVFLANGYKPGIYANQNYWENYLNDPQFNAYYKWIANYGKNDGYPSSKFSPKDDIKNYMMWQYSSTVYIDGIVNNTVDCNALFDWYLKPDGWKNIHGKYYHYSNANLTTGWYFENNKWYYLDKLGQMATDWVNYGYNWYYLDSDGSMVSNQWRKDSKGWVYLGSDGAMLTNAWCTDSAGWCYVGADGYAVTNCWKQDSIGWIWLNSEGSMTKNAWVQDGGNWYYLDENGYMVSNQWRKDSIGWVYLGSSGAMLTNAWCKDSAGWCYVGADGYAVTNCWKQDSIGWIWLNSEGSMTKNSWVLDGGSWYWLNKDGYMVTGWQLIGGTWYNFASSGVWIG